MSEKLSGMIANFLVCRNVIGEEEKEIYQYGYETLLYSVAQTMGLFLLGMILGKGIEAIVFVVVFASLRQYTGGYHANTRTGCCFMTVIVYLAVLYIQTLQGLWADKGIFILLSFVLYFLIYITFVPVEHENKPLTEEQKRRYKVRGSILSVVYSILAMLLFSVAKSVAYTILWTMMMVALLITIQMQRGGE